MWSRGQIGAADWPYARFVSSLWSALSPPHRRRTVVHLNFITALLKKSIDINAGIDANVQ